MVATRFAVAVHILMLLAARREAGPATSALLADSVNTNPVVVRRITGRLARAGLLLVRRGRGGAELLRPPERITLGEVWRAVAAEGPVLAVHERPNAACPVGCRVQAVLGGVFGRADAAMVSVLDGTTLAGVLKDAGADG